MMSTHVTKTLLVCMTVALNAAATYENGNVAWDFADLKSSHTGWETHIIGDSIAVGLKFQHPAALGYAQVGSNPTTIYNAIVAGGYQLQGAKVLLSSGIMNNTIDFAGVKNQLQYLTSHGASVRLVGAANGNYESQNQELARLASEYGVTFMGGFTPGADGVHPPNYQYAELYQAVSQIDVADPVDPPADPVKPADAEPSTPEPEHVSPIVPYVDPSASNNWSSKTYAPYADMLLWPTPNLVDLSKEQGMKFFTLAFLNPAADGELAWGGNSILKPGSNNDIVNSISSSITALRATGGDVIISLGGDLDSTGGMNLAQKYVSMGRNAQQLADAYKQAADTYGLRRIDFDIEGAAAADLPSIALRNDALVLLQKACPELDVWFTLGALPAVRPITAGGLTAEGVHIVQSALRAGVRIAGINIMAMNYGEWNAPTGAPGSARDNPGPHTMGYYAIEAAKDTHSQLSALYRAENKTFGYEQLGVTPMIGVNAALMVQPFTEDDARALLAFADEQNLGMLSMWSVARDQAGSSGVSSINSGIQQEKGAFSKILSTYAGASQTPSHTDPVGPVTPVDPVTPAQPVQPVDPVEPVTPAKPDTPVTPVAPYVPVSPVDGEAIKDAVRRSLHESREQVRRELEKSRRELEKAIGDTVVLETLDRAMETAEATSADVNTAALRAVEEALAAHRRE